jgi:hypothetical protein
VDEPVRGRLRPASSRGLTSPDPVTAPPGHTAPGPAAKQTTRTLRRKVSGRASTPAPAPKITLAWSPQSETTTPFTRWIEA